RFLLTVGGAAWYFLFRSTAWSDGVFQAKPLNDTLPPRVVAVRLSATHAAADRRQFACRLRLIDVLQPMLPQGDGRVCKQGLFLRRAAQPPMQAAPTPLVGPTH